MDDGAIPTGEFLPVENTPFDFQAPHTIGERIDAVPGPAPGGYDHNYVLFNLGVNAKFATTLGAASNVYVLVPSTLLCCLLSCLRVLWQQCRPKHCLIHTLTPQADGTGRMSCHVIRTFCFSRLQKRFVLLQSEASRNGV